MMHKYFLNGFLHSTRERRLIGLNTPSNAPNNPPQDPVVTEEMKNVIKELAKPNGNSKPHEEIRAQIRLALKTGGVINDAEFRGISEAMELRMRRLPNVPNINDIIAQLPKNGDDMLSFASRSELFTDKEVHAAIRQGVLNSSPGNAPTSRTSSPSRGVKYANGVFTYPDGTQKTRDEYMAEVRARQAERDAYWEAKEAPQRERDQANLRVMKEFNQYRGGGGDMAHDRWDRKNAFEKYAGKDINGKQIRPGYHGPTGNDVARSEHLERNRQKGAINYKSGYSDLPIARTAKNKNGDTINRAAEYDAFMAQNGQGIYGPRDPNSMSDALDPASQNTADAYGSAKRQREADRQFNAQRNNSFNKIDTNSDTTQREINDRYAAEKNIQLEAKIRSMGERYWVTRGEDADGNSTGFSLMYRVPRFRILQDKLNQMRANTGPGTGYNSSTDLQRALDLADAVDADAKKVLEAFTIEREKIADLRTKPAEQWIEGNQIMHGLDGYQYIVGEDDRPFAFNKRTGKVSIYKVEMEQWVIATPADIARSKIKIPAVQLYEEPGAIGPNEAPPLKNEKLMPLKPAPAREVDETPGTIVGTPEWFKPPFIGTFVDGVYEVRGNSKPHLSAGFEIHPGRYDLKNMTDAQQKLSIKRLNDPNQSQFEARKLIQEGRRTNAPEISVPTPAPTPTPQPTPELPKPAPAPKPKQAPTPEPPKTETPQSTPTPKPAPQPQPEPIPKAPETPKPAPTPKNIEPTPEPVVPVPEPPQPETPKPAPKVEPTETPASEKPSTPEGEKPAVRRKQKKLGAEPTPLAQPEEKPVEKPWDDVDELLQVGNDDRAYGAKIFGTREKFKDTPQWSDFAADAIAVAKQTREVGDDQKQEAATIEYNFLKDNIPLWMKTPLKPMFIARLQNVTRLAKQRVMSVQEMEEIAKNPPSPKAPAETETVDPALKDALKKLDGIPDEAVDPALEEAARKIDEL